MPWTYKNNSANQNAFKQEAMDFNTDPDYFDNSVRLEVIKVIELKQTTITILVKNEGLNEHLKEIYKEQLDNDTIKITARCNGWYVPIKENGLEAIEISFGVYDCVCPAKEINIHITNYR